MDDAPTGARARTRTLAIVAALGAVAVVAAVALRGGGSGAGSAGTADVNPAAQALEEAKGLLQHGDVEGALRRSQEIPEESNLRESGIFKEIQTRWADGVFEQAAQETDRTRKRALLDLIAKSPDVGSMLRKRAANEITRLDSDSVGIEELPSAGKQKTAEPPRPTGAPASPPPPPSPPSKATVVPASAKRKGEVKGGLVRDTPF